MKTLFIALRATLVTLVLTGLVYPLAMTGIIQGLFPAKANGSLVKDDAGNVVGSSLIGQAFTNPGYLQGRPSAAGNGYDATSSGGSNFGPAAAKLRDRLKGDVERLHKENPDAPGTIPTELVTASASGLDPQLSPEAARWQVPRIARARGIEAPRVLAVIDEQAEGRDLGLFGEPTVNVLEVNLALDRKLGRPRAVEKAPAAQAVPASPPAAQAAPAP
jgi:K+-transporting ATPase ATPase C chain